MVGMETGGYRLNWKSSGQVPSECDIVKSSKLFAESIRNKFERGEAFYAWPNVY